jgi:uroporphyrinogen-III synthase
MQGKTIAILETRLGSQLGELVARHGAKPFPAPALSEEPDIDDAYIERFIEELAASAPKAVIFQTGVGTRALFDACDRLGLAARLTSALEATTVVARGPKPTGALRQRGVRIDRSAADPFTTAEVLAAISDVDLNGEWVVIQRYGATNEKLDHALEQRGARITEIPTYRWALPKDTAPLIALMDALDHGRIDATVFTSASQALNLFTLAAQLGRSDGVRAGLNRTFVASIGPVCSEALREHGLAVAFEASPPKLGPLVDGLNARLR